jgi:hypothetical protein
MPKKVRILGALAFSSGTDFRVFFIGYKEFCSELAKIKARRREQNRLYSS